MIGAIVLYVIAVVAGLRGMLIWINADSVETAFPGIALCLIATISLTGALVIDGVRHYANKLSTQLGYLLKPGSVFANAVAPAPTVTSNSSSSSSSMSSSVRSSAIMRNYQVVGRDQRTGRDTELVISASDETDALRAGENRGLDVKRVALAK